MRRGSGSRRGGSGQLDIDGYTDLVEIGSGTSATVYRAFQEAFQRQVALKVLTADIRDQRAQKRFGSERAMTGRLSRHPNVITVYDAGFVAGRRPYLAMEYFAAGSYADLLEASGPLPVADLLRVGVKIAGALESAHRAEVIHRDIKPQNILRSGYGEPVLADFGLAIAADPEASFTAGLTPAHAAPELLEGGLPTVASDIYALGSTLYSLLAGRAPFAGPPGEGLLAQFRRIAVGDVPDIPRADLPPTVMRLLRRALATVPADRYRTAAELGRALQAEQTALGVPVTDLVLEAETALAPTRTSIVSTGPQEETATRAAAFAPAPRPVEVPVPQAVPTPGTPVSPSLGGTTLVGRLPVPTPPPPAASPSRRRPVVLAAAAIGVLALAGIGVAASGAVGSKATTANRPARPSPTVVPSAPVAVSPTASPTASPDASPSVANAPPGTPSLVPTSSTGVENTGPTDVTVRADGGGLLRVSWHDHTGGTATYLIYASAGSAYRLSREAARGMTSAVITATPGAAACYRVIAVISLGYTPGSAAVCINGGVAPTATPS